ncbi:MAG: hypothetical protein ACTHNP_01880 [Solirubrobacterales bacterium]
MPSIELSPQAEAIVAGLLDEGIRREELETGESQIFADDRFWEELLAAFPRAKFYRRLNSEGQIE